MHTTDKGAAATLIIASRLMMRGKTVLMPTSDNLRYDLALDDNGLLVRIQCKAGRIRDGVVLFNSRSSSKFVKGGKSISYHGQVEYVAVHCPDNDKSYLIPISHVPLSLGTLRLDPPKNQQKKKITMAQEFEI